MSCGVASTRRACGARRGIDAIRTFDLRRNGRRANARQTRLTRMNARTSSGPSHLFQQTLAPQPSMTSLARAHDVVRADARDECAVCDRRRFASSIRCTRKRETGGCEISALFSHEPAGQLSDRCTRFDCSAGSAASTPSDIRADTRNQQKTASSREPCREDTDEHSTIAHRTSASCKAAMTSAAPLASTRHANSHDARLATLPARLTPASRTPR